MSWGSLIVVNKQLNLIYFLSTSSILENKIYDRAKYVAAPEFNNFAGTILDEKLKQAGLATNRNLNDVSLTK